jgi:hypothetical protein
MYHTHEYVCVTYMSMCVSLTYAPPLYHSQAVVDRLTNVSRSLQSFAHQQSRYGHIVQSPSARSKVLCGRFLAATETLAGEWL